MERFKVLFIGEGDSPSLRCFDKLALIAGKVLKTLSQQLLLTNLFFFFICKRVLNHNGYFKEVLIIEAFKSLHYILHV